MEAKVDKIVVTPQGIWFGLQITGPKGSWVRFARLLVPADTIPWQEIDAMRSVWLSTEPDGLDEPLF